VDRRAVVDQATAEAEKLRDGLENLPLLKAALNLGKYRLPISTLRGKFTDNREWQENPAASAIIVGTVDMIGSRLLFSGYGVSRKMRPYHAGLLGVDTLVVLDEAHLVPPFEKLLEAIEKDVGDFGPRTEACRGLIPSFKLLSLSATGRERQGDTFRLDEEDLKDDFVKQRLDAAKRIKLGPALTESDLPAKMANQAWERGAGGHPVIVFCNSRKTAQKVYDQLQEKLKKNFKEDFTKPDFVIGDVLELIVGARRVHEREKLSQCAAFKRFLGKRSAESNETLLPAFLVCTSAGEVGIDIDADHMVCDLVPWERMVQRLGRVNRSGTFLEGSLVDIFPALSNKDKEAEIEIDTANIETWSRPFESPLWESNGEGRKDGRPGKLRKLASIADFKSLSDAATTPPPLRPALTRSLVDAWSMTSLETHTGRPDVAPWLRGWIEEEEPQTVLVWRKYLPVRWEDALASGKEIADFFEAAPPHMSEQLETETWRVVEWLMERAGHITQELSGSKTISDDRDGPSDLPPLTRESIVVLVLGTDDKFMKYRLSDLIKTDHDKKRPDRLSNEFASATLILDARLAGLGQGVLKKDFDTPPLTADGDDDWSKAVGLRLEQRTSLEPTDDPDWRFEDAFAIMQTNEGEATEWLVVERLKAASYSENGRAISNPQLLFHHQSCAAEKARMIATALSLPEDFARALEIAARLHDEGKKALRWQRAFNAFRDAKRLGGPLAKTRGPINQALLDGYRHEFGSLRYVEKDAEFEKLSTDLQHLVLHIVAAHHGGARPVIETKSCDDAPPSGLEARARDVALRFARLQKIWGPWGLAWWETLLRAADQLASRENDERNDADGKTASGEAA
jgi:CRISPR-associated endonuclease/helicase Cas3